MKRFFRENRGGAVIEHAMVMPVWIVIFTVMIQATLIWWGQSVVLRSAIRGARAAVVQIPRDDTGTANCLNSTKRRKINKAVRGTLRSLGHDNLMTISTNTKVGFDDHANCYDETENVTVEVKYKMRLVVPVANKLLADSILQGGLDFTGMPTTELVARATMRNEGLKRTP